MNRIVIEGKIDSVWKRLAVIDLPVSLPLPLPPSQEFKVKKKIGPFSVTLIGRVRVE